MTWTQGQVQLPPLSRGWHLVTDAVVSAVPELAQTDCGVLHVFIQHTLSLIHI